MTMSLRSRITVVAVFFLVVGIALGAGGTLLIAGSGKTSTRVVTTSDSSTLPISAPLSQDQLLAKAKAAKLDKFFWLGDPPSGEDVRTPTTAANGQFAVFYTDVSERSSYEKKSARYAYLNELNTELLPKSSQPSAQFIAQLTKEAVSVQAGDGFTAYVLMPPISTKIGADIMLISDDHRYGGRLVTGNSELVKSQRESDLIKLAGEIQLSSTD